VASAAAEEYRQAAMSNYRAQRNTDYERLRELEEYSPSEFSNLVAEREVERQPWHKRLSRFFPTRQHRTSNDDR
jgi:hypothetical protein